MSQHSGTSVHEAYGKAVEERMYALATEELTHGAVRVGLWACGPRLGLWPVAITGKQKRAI